MCIRDRAEGRLLEALTEFSHAAKTTYQGRLFAHDALQGLRIIDLCREIFDVVVMNPPFGALATNTKDRLVRTDRDSKNDLVGIFVERGFQLWRPAGLLGAITARTCFFLSSFEKWREYRIFNKTKPIVVCLLYTSRCV